MSVEIKYKGSPIAVLEEGEKVTIHCDGKFMEEDIVVTTLPTKKIITFTVKNIDPKNDFTHQADAEEGMTWGEWLDSEYRADGYYKDEGFVEYRGYNKSYVWNSAGERVMVTDIIVENEQYTIDVHKGGSN